ncbi:MAG TPA: response regulator transcription factor [Solirubrobacteraceae bacterium]|nr:response regulator transcription factor [Solirubrobacteraceae bacterium]
MTASTAALQHPSFTSHEPIARALHSVAAPLDPLPQLARLALPDPLRLAVLDDDRGFVTTLKRTLEQLDWKSHVLAQPVSSWALGRMKLHVLVLDTAAVGDDWLEWVGQVAEELPDLRIVVCATSSTLGERLSALRVGVDDWMAKPCHTEELIARVESVVRGRKHIEPAIDEAPLVTGELTISPGHRQAFARGTSSRLTPREFSLLHLLAKRESCVIDRAIAYAEVWGHPMAQRRDRSVDVHVRRIRTKLKRVSPRWNYIHTHYGVGYRFRATLEEEGAELVPHGGLTLLPA